MFLQNLDTVIAFSVVMLLLSLVITTLVQMAISILGLRGRQLAWGVRMLFEQADKELAKDGKAAKVLAKQVLTHRTLGPSFNLVAWIWDRLLKRRKRSGKPPTAAGRRPPTAITLKNIQLVLESLEREKASNKELQAWIASLSQEAQDAANGLLAGGEELKKRLGKWFETVMDATSERFKLWSRWITAVGAVLLAFGLQVDSVEIFKQLHMSPKVRAQLVADAQQVQGLYDQATQTTDGSKESRERLEALKETRDAVYERLGDLDTEGLTIYRPFVEWSEPDEGVGVWAHRFGLVWKRLWSPTPGMLMTALLLSLGAPFWYKMLANVLSFRSIVARKEDKPQPETADGSAGK